MYRISQIAKQFGLSRSTLLYYDKIGLLRPSFRSVSNYRSYTSSDVSRLELIRSFREAGLAVKDIRSILNSGKDRLSIVLKRRLNELSEQCIELRKKQRLIAGMLKLRLEALPLANVDKGIWVDMLRSAGIGEVAMQAWHCEFEKRAPSAHHEFLLSLGVSEKEAKAIRECSRKETQPVK